MTIGVVGCGNMGQALIRGILAKRLIAPRGVIAWDPDLGKLAALARTVRIRKANSNRQVAEADCILLAVKPQQMEEVLQEIQPVLQDRLRSQPSRPLVISIAAGISTRWIGRRVGKSVPVIRVMPNTPALVGCGISAIAAGRSAGWNEMQQAQRIFSCVGEVVTLPESALNAVTAVSGSGPAYFFYLMEEMIQAGISLGLSEVVARRLVLQTAAGSAKMAQSSGGDLDLLRARVTSKGGTTEAAFQLFLKKRLGQTIRQGIQAAAARAKEMGR